MVGIAGCVRDNGALVAALDRTEHGTVVWLALFPGVHFFEVHCRGFMGLTGIG